MKLFIAAVLFFGLTGSAHAALFELSHAGRNIVCEDDPVPPEGDWRCSTEEISRDGDLLEYGCKGSEAWACMVTEKETCTDMRSGKTNSITRKSFVGCAANLADCW